MLCVALQGAGWYLSGGWFHFRVLREAVMHDSTMRLAEAGSLAGRPQYWGKVITFNIWNVQKQIASEDVMGQGDWNRWTNHNSAILGQMEEKLAERASCWLEMIYICKKLTCAPVTYSTVLAIKRLLKWEEIFNIVTKTLLTCCNKCLKATHTVLYDFTYCWASFPIWRGRMK